MKKYQKTMQLVVSSCALVSLASACGTPTKTNSRSGSVASVQAQNLQDCYAVPVNAAKLTDAGKGSSVTQNSGYGSANNNYGSANNSYGSANNSYGYGNSNGGSYGSGGDVGINFGFHFSVGGFLHNLFHGGDNGGSYGNANNGYGNAGNASYGNGQNGSVSGSVNASYGNSVNASYGNGNSGKVSYGNGNSGKVSYGNGQGGQCTSQNNNGSYNNGNVVVTGSNGQGKGVEPPPPGANYPAQQPGGKTPCGPGQTPAQTPSQNPNYYTPVGNSGKVSYAYPPAQQAGKAGCGSNGLYCDDGANGQWPAQTVGGATYDQAVAQACFQAFRASGYNTQGQWGIDVRTYGDAAALSSSGIQDSGTSQLLVIIDAVDVASAAQFNLLDAHALYCVQGMISLANVTVNSCYNGNVALGSPAALVTSGIAVQGCSN